MFGGCFPIIDGCFDAPLKDTPFVAPQTSLCIVNMHKKKFKQYKKGEFRIFNIPKELENQLHSYI